jgi:hypothetical protein
MVIVRWILSVLAVLSFAGTVPPAVTRMHSLGERLEASQQQRLAHGKGPRVTFQLTESEINQYFDYSLRDVPRPGIDSIRLKFFPNNYISSFSVIDFDAVEQWKPGTIPLLMRPVLRGKKGLLIDLRFQAANGETIFEVEKAYLDKLRIPVVLVEKLIETVAERQPEKYDTTRPLPLPYGLRRVWTQSQRLAGEN